MWWLWCFAWFFGNVDYSPYLSIRGWSLSDDRAGLRRGQSLLDHYAGVMVAHPWVWLLVLALTCLSVQWDVLQRQSKQVYKVRNLSRVLHSFLKVAQLKHYNCLALGAVQPACVGNEELCKLSSTDIQSTDNLQTSPEIKLVKYSLLLFTKHDHLFVLHLLHIKARSFLLLWYCK